MLLNNKTAVITGGSRGLGRAIAVAFAKEGCNSVIADLLESEAQETIAAVKSFGKDCIFAKCDVSNPTIVNDMVAKAIEKFGKIDILVNNAGMSVVGPSTELEERRWRTGIDVMLNGVFFCSQAVARGMIKQKYGKIINIASVNGIVAFPERACYCAAKGGVVSLTKALGCEWARHNINVNAIAPGYIATDLVKDLASKGTLDVDELAERTPVGRIASGEEIAAVITFLASDDAKYIQGQTIVADGGWTAYGYLESWLKNARNRKD